MYVRDHMRRDFFAALGFDVDDFDRRVLRLTNDIARQVFPDTIDLEHPRAFALMDEMFRNTAALKALEGAAGLGARLRRARLLAANGLAFARLFLMRPRRQALPADVRLQPVW
jgi:magnesium-protoporphyrin IX monomethyl ester (oxidative) cyclase